MRRLALGFALFLAILVTFAFLVLPVVAIFTHVSIGTLIDQLSNPLVHDALIVTLKTTLVAQAAILLFGTPTAWFLATRRFPGRARPATARSTDVFPAPDGPTSATVRPTSSARSSAKERSGRVNSAERVATGRSA